MKNNTAFCISGTHSGVGKTTISVALMQYCIQQGYSVQPFKVGPDFIDPIFHKYTTGLDSYNLDTFLSSKHHVHTLFNEKRKNADIAIVEGVMGLFDGASATEEYGSTAELSRILSLPIILVVNAKGMGRSLSAVLHGFTTFDSTLHFAGIIATRVGSPKHERYITEICSTYFPSIPLLGCIPHNAFSPLPERHLGLSLPQKEAFHSLSILYAQTLAQYCSLEQIIPTKIQQKSSPIELLHSTTQETSSPQEYPKRTIAISYDEAFCFLYPENLEILRAMFPENTIEYVFFSPLHDSYLPQCHAIFLLGGYPELYAQELHNNTSMKESICDASKKNIPLYAECGGFMYLMQSLEDKEGTLWNMVGIFPIQSTMNTGRKALGYRYIAEASTPHSYISKGHEFHYSMQKEECTQGNALWAVYDSSQQFLGYHGCKIGNTFGSYIHILFAENTIFLAKFLALCNTTVEYIPPTISTMQGKFHGADTAL